MSIFEVVMMLFASSQLFWAWRAHRFFVRRIPDVRRRKLVEAAVAVVYFAMLYANRDTFDMSRHTPTPIQLTAYTALVSAPFLWWFAGSFFGFLLAALFAPIRGALWVLSKAWQFVRADRPDVPASAERREFLGRTAAAVAGMPFVAGGYGMLYGRLNLETSHRQIRLARLPKAFAGFRIAQLSDIHIGPFMPQEQIRKYVEIANSLKPDLFVLTGDFVTWRAETQGPVVEVLSRLRAPFGVFGCLGNHDIWSGVEDSITELFGRAGIRILRQARAAITQSGESLNLIGVDFEPMRRSRDEAFAELLDSVPALMERDRVNILLSHNPNTFDRAAALGVDLSLAGHTHGGQGALEFISPQLAPSRLVTPYVAGWFQQPGGQLYVNRGIGTVGVPIRIGAPPEISVFELVRG